MRATVISEDFTVVPYFDPPYQKRSFHLLRQREEQKWIMPKRPILQKSLPILPVTSLGKVSPWAESQSSIMMIYSWKVALGQIYYCPTHTTLFLSPKDIFPVKSNVRKGHTHQSMLITPPFLFPSKYSEQLERKEEKCITMRVNKILKASKPCMAEDKHFSKHSSHGAYLLFWNLKVQQ